MKIISVTILLVLSIFIFASCRQKAKEEANPIDIEVSAKNYLQPMLQVGDSSTNIIARFGLPLSQHETGMHEWRMDFFSLILTTRQRQRVLGDSLVFLLIINCLTGTRFTKGETLLPALAPSQK